VELSELRKVSKKKFGALVARGDIYAGHRVDVSFLGR
jgi:hypothetical protein